MEQQKKSRFSKVKVGLAAVALGALLVVPVSADQHTQDGTATLDITAGELSATIAEAIEMSDVPFSATTDETSTGDAAMSVTDLRGGTGDWQVTLGATEFTSGETADEIGADELTYTGAANAEEENGTVTHESDVTGFDTAAQVIANATDAHGEATWDGGLSLNVPALTSAGEYSSTLTITAVDAP